MVERTRAPDVLGRYPSPLLPLLGSGLLIIGIIAALTGWAILQGRADARHTAELATANLSQILADYFASEVQQIDLGLLAIADEVERQRGRRDTAAIDAEIARQNSRHPDALGFRIFGADGSLQAGDSNLANRSGNIAQRAYFIAHRDDAASGLLVGPAEFGITTQTWRISLSRRLSHADGSFAGVVICSIPTTALLERYSRLDLGRRGVVMLAHANFELAARFPAIESESTPNPKVDSRFQGIITSGTRVAEVEYRSPVDGVDRLATIRNIDGMPYHILVGMAEDDYLADWRRNTRWSLLFATLMSALVLLAIHVLHRRIGAARQAEESLRTNEFRWKLALEGTGAGVCDWNMCTGETDYSARWREIFGYGERDFLPGISQSMPLVHPDDRTRVDAALRAYLSGESDRFLAELRMRCADGHYKWILGRALFVSYSADGKPQRMIGTSTDISKRKRNEEQLRLIGTAFTHALEAIVLCDVESGTTVIDVNLAFTRITGYCREEVIGRRVIELEAFRYEKEAYETTQRALFDRGYWSGELPHYRKNGDCYPALLSVSAVRDDKGELRQFVAFFSDISQQKEQQRQLEQAAYCDTLTGLPNRRLLHERLTLALAASRRSGQSGALMLLDLDNFKPLNDEHGHAVGDLLLIDVARRLDDSVREVDTVARLGGDEFVVVLSGLDADVAFSRRQARAVAEKIRAALAAPYVLVPAANAGEAPARVEHRCSASIGVTLFTDAESDPEALLKRADKAMYRAKESGRGSIEFGEPPLVAAPAEDLAEKLVHLAWRVAYECGNPLIDEQHRALVATANRLLAAILSGHSSGQVAALIDVLLRDLVQHFKDEEAIIAAAGFPAADEHAAIHRRLVAAAVEFVEHFHSGTLGSGEMFSFLAHDIVANHILGADREFFPYLRQREEALSSSSS